MVNVQQWRDDSRMLAEGLYNLYNCYSYGFGEARFSESYKHRVRRVERDSGWKHAMKGHVTYATQWVHRTGRKADQSGVPVGQSSGAMDLQCQ